MRKPAAILSYATVAVVAFSGPAAAMGSGNEFEDMQVGVTYTVYEPSYTSGLPLQHFGGNSACPDGTEENALAKYGTTPGRQVTITEGNPMCSDIGQGVQVRTASVGGAKAKVYAYCSPAAAATCTTTDVRRRGGFLAVTLPAAAGLRSTTVWIETFGTVNVTARQLIRIARSLAPAG
jgi:hypothetical protein